MITINFQSTNYNPRVDQYKNKFESFVVLRIDTEGGSAKIFLKSLDELRELLKKIEAEIEREDEQLIK